MAKKEGAKPEAVELGTLVVRSVNEGGAEVRLSDEDGRVSLVFRGQKTLARKLSRGVRGTLSFTPDPAETAENIVTVEIPAEDTGGLPGSAKEVKKGDSA